jgi:ketosteroid isomerase-like protein
MEADTLAIIRQLEQRLRAATLHNDIALHQELLADTWMNTNANGTITTKTQLLHLLQSQPFAFVAIEDADVHIRTYGQCAIVTGLSMRSRAGQDGNTITQQVRFTRVYACLEERWQVVAAQATPMPVAT